MKRRILLTVTVCLVAGASAYGAWISGGRSWIGLWLSPDQQGRHYFEKGDYATAAQRFRDPLWKGVALYRSGDFRAAVGQFALVETAEGYFNLGNAYAHMGQIEQAAASYEQALQHRPNDKLIQENLDLMRSLILAKAAKKEQEPPQEGDPSYSPDAIKIDEKGKMGKTGQVDQKPLSDEQIQELWMRRLQTSPADFLRMKFSIQLQESETGRPRATSEGGH